jgi:hypothetical protein
LKKLLKQHKEQKTDRFSSNCAILNFMPSTFKQHIVEIAPFVAFLYTVKWKALKKNNRVFPYDATCGML